MESKFNHLFLAVSTAFTMTEPFVPGNLTYSSLGAGTGTFDCALRLLRPSISAVLGEPGRSSERRGWNAFVITLGKKRVPLWAGADGS